MKTRPILVTGAAGFVGSHVVRRLLAEGSCVAILVKQNTNLERIEDILDEVVVLQADIVDRHSLSVMMKHLQPKGIYHLAASNISSGRTASDEEVLAVNLMGTKNLIDSLDEVEYDFFVQTGSFMEYGPKDHPLSEDEVCGPTELYSITKLGATLYGQAVSKQKNKPISTVRLFTPYGPNMQSGRLVYEVLFRALKGEIIHLTNEKVTRDFIFIDDVVDLMMSVARNAGACAGEVFNAGSGAASSLQSFVDLALKLTDSHSVVKWNNRPLLPYDSLLWKANMDKAQEIIGWRPITTLEDGLRKTITWFKESGARI